MPYNATSASKTIKVTGPLPIELLPLIRIVAPIIAGTIIFAASKR
jgi:hypothetical protein